MDDAQKIQSYFPLKILLEGDLEMIVNTPDEIPLGVNFRILVIRYEETSPLGGMVDTRDLKSLG